MTLSVRDAMIESWGITDEGDEDTEAEQDFTAAAEDGDERLTQSETDQTDTENYENSVQSDFDEGC